MQSVALFLVAVAILVVVEGRSPPLELETCTTDNDCQQTHCCTDPNAPEVVSRKRQVPIAAATGICRPYLLPGSACYYHDRRSCGCSPGYYCKYFPVTTTVADRSSQLSADESPAFRPAPGRYNCNPVPGGPD